LFCSKKKNPDNHKWLKPIYIYTSGLLVYGENGNHVLDSTWITKSKSLTTRTTIENTITSHPNVRGVVLRPGWVYGGSGGFYGNDLFEVPQDGELVLTGSESKKWSWVHVEDLADAYVKVVNAGSIVDGEVFDIVGPSAPTYGEIKVAAAKVAGWKGSNVKIVEPEGFWIICEVSIVTNSHKAFNLLGWREKHLGIINEMELFYRSYKAFKSLTF